MGDRTHYETNTKPTFTSFASCGVKHLPPSLAMAAWTARRMGRWVKPRMEMVCLRRNAASKGGKKSVVVASRRT